MLTNELPIIDDVSKTVYKVTADEKARMELFARQDTLRRENDARLLRQRAEDALAKTQVELAETQSELVETKSELAETHSRLTKTQSELAEKMSENSNMQNEIIELKKRLSELESRQDLKQ